MEGTVEEVAGRCKLCGGWKHIRPNAYLACPTCDLYKEMLVYVEPKKPKRWWWPLR